MSKYNETQQNNKIKNKIEKTLLRKLQTQD